MIGGGGGFHYAHTHALAHFHTHTPTHTSTFSLPPNTHTAPADPHRYLNSYRHGWLAFTNGQRALMEETKKKKKPLSDLPPLLPLSRFTWPQSAGKGSTRGTVRCGKCPSCMQTALKKPCMYPVKAGEEGDVLSDTSSKYVGCVSVYDGGVCFVCV